MWCCGFIHARDGVGGAACDADSPRSVHHDRVDGVCVGAVGVAFGAYFGEWGF
jgi:hypothetical protein